MEKETIKLLNKILDNQIILFKRLDDIEHKIKGGIKSAPLTSFERDLEKEREKLERQRENL